MDLKWLLVRRIAAVALTCLVIASAWAVQRTARDARGQNGDLAAAAARQFDIQLDRIGRALDAPGHFPDWDLVKSYDLLPGQCVQLVGNDGALKRSRCAGVDAASAQAPRWFVTVYRALFGGEMRVAHPVAHRGAPHGTVVAEYAPVATASRAWGTIAPLLGFAAAFAAVLCFVTYLVIDRALLPTKDILDGLNRLSRGDLTARLPAFRLAELNRISEVFNALSADLSKATSERSELARRLVDAQEQERRHIARELHDEIAQKLSALNAHAACIRTGAQREAPALADEIRDLEAAASGLMVSLRRTLSDLRPQVIDDLGLIPGLQALVEQHNHRARGATSYSIEVAGDVERLRAESSAHVYRIVQEALTNAAKHAQARNVTVRLSQRIDAGQETIRLSVFDDGAGPADEPSPPTGSGIIGMRERVAALSGKFIAGPLPSGGFGLQVEFPTLARGT